MNGPSGATSRKRLEERKHFSNMLKSYNTQEALRNNSSSNLDVRIKKKKVQNILTMLEERSFGKKGQIPLTSKTSVKIRTK